MAKSNRPGETWGRRWTQEDEDKLICMYGKGHSIDVIADELDRSPDSITSKLYRIKKDLERGMPNDVKQSKQLKPY